MPVLAMEADGKLVLDPSEVLATIGQAHRGKRSGNPGDPEALKPVLRRLKNAVYQSFRDINLVSTIQPKLVCWMEMRRA